MPHPDDDREIADASFLFDERPDRPAPAGRPEPRRGPSSSDPTGPAAPADEDAYDLADHGPPDREPPRDAAGPVPPVPPPVERPRADERRPKEVEPSPVDHPWTRLGEWGPALVRIGIAALATALLAYGALSAGRLGLAMAIASIGLAVAVLLSYPIAITLERPVRMTPEHALRDYYAALSHHVPQFRRMWLLLSSAGRDADPFRSYAEFASYWARTLSDLKGGSAGPRTPVTARVEQFKSEKSGGQEAIAVSYTLTIVLRGREADGPLFSSRTETTLSRGPDRMWYLDEGTLPRT